MHHGSQVRATEHIYALPGGTQAITGFSAYASGTRHRRASYLVLSEGAERAAVARSRLLNDVRPVTRDEIWSNVADNLGRQPSSFCPIGGTTQHPGAASPIHTGYAARY